MTHETGTRTGADGTALFTRRWTPDRPTRAVVVLVHGVHEHSGRYAYLASALMARGIAVRALDLRGHGQSGGPRGQVESFGDYVADVRPFLDEVVAEAAVPVFLMGHSMGGLVVAATVVERGTGGLAGVVLSSPALRVDAPPLLRWLAPLVARWFPDLPATRVDLGRLSRDPTVARAYRKDPHTITHGVRARLGLEILTAAERVREHPEAFDVPLYLFHGTEDRLTDPGRLPLAREPRRRRRHPPHLGGVLPRDLKRARARRGDRRARGLARRPHHGARRRACLDAPDERALRSSWRWSSLPRGSARGGTPRRRRRCGWGPSWRPSRRPRTRRWSRFRTGTRPGRRRARATTAGARG